MSIAQPSDLPTPKRKIRNLYILTPSRGLASVQMVAWLYTVREQAGELGFRFMPWFCVPYLDVVTARQHCVQHVLDVMKEVPNVDEHWCLWVDDDMLPSMRSIAQLYTTMLMKPDIAVLSALFCRRQPDDFGLVPSVGLREWMLPGRDYKQGDIVETDWVSLAFTLHRADIFQKMPEPWFRSDSDGLAGEDAWCTHQMRRAGFRTFVHTGCIVGHCDPPSLKPNDRPTVYYPITSVTTAEPQKEGDIDILKAVVDEKIPDLKIERAEGEPILAFLNCNTPALAHSMLIQFNGGKIVILDNGSHLDEDFDNRYLGWSYAVISTPKNIGWGPGVNKLMEEIIANMPDVKAVWACNDDITGVNPAMARQLYDVLMADPKAAVISPTNKMCSWAMMHQQGNGQLRKVPYVDFCAPMIKVEAWKEVGPFDIETFGAGHGLDVDWCYRARQKGWNLLIDDALSFEHPTPGTTCFSAGTIEEHCSSEWASALVHKHGKTIREIALGL